jgi:hypothetical protein
MATETVILTLMVMCLVLALPLALRWVMLTVKIRAMKKETRMDWG